jgi:hypothetical protein
MKSPVHYPSTQYLADVLVWYLWLTDLCGGVSCVSLWQAVTSVCLLLFC